MAGKRPIDIKRDAAINLHIGGDDKSAAKEFLSTGDGLYVIKETGIFKIQLADDIDPGRTNPNIPNLSQQVLTEGYNNEIVARVLLTAKSLFDANNATVTPYVATLFENCIVLTRQLLELDAMTRELADEIGRKEAAFAAKPAAPNAYSLPSVPGLDTKLHNILSKADKAKDTILAIFCLEFLSDAGGKVKLENLDKAVETSLQTEPQLIAAWKETAKYFGLVRNMRNVCEHPKENYRVVLTDFAMQPGGHVNPPLVAIQHPETPIRALPVVEFLEFIRDTMLEHAETIVVFIRFAALLKHNRKRSNYHSLPAVSAFC
ncbi:MAG: hypothetical protein JWO52_3777 [Gammaproteobacteria bacterium]|nr:hypothetical protein [Gammaproteobacteria bacterium]